jgi:tripartite-type tricarboxylate transporter receptor subunit TctC
MTVVLPHVRSGRLHALGVTAATRVKALPDVPSIAESGVPGYEALQWAGLLAPAGTPRDIVVKLHKESAAILRRPETVELLARDNNIVVASSPEEFTTFIKAEITKWAAVVKAAGIQPE